MSANGDSLSFSDTEDNGPNEYLAAPSQASQDNSYVEEDFNISYPCIDGPDFTKLPMHACLYCGIHDVGGVVKCSECDRWFCNGKGKTSGAHILQHLIRSHHKEIEVHPESPIGGSSIECYHCEAKNIFVLGFIPSKDDNFIMSANGDDVSFSDTEDNGPSEYLAAPSQDSEDNSYVEEDFNIRYPCIDGPDFTKLPMHACLYCGIHDVGGVVKCSECDRWFCNGKGKTSGAHILQHLIRSRHKEIEVHPESSIGDSNIECYHCEAKNIFVLGFIPSKDDNVIVILCRNCSTNCGKSENWNNKELSSLISNRSLLPWLVKFPSRESIRNAFKISASQIRALEELWTRNPKAVFSDLNNPENMEDVEPVRQAINVEIMASTLINAGILPNQIGIITPYSGQSIYLTRQMSLSGSLNSKVYEEIEIANVDGFQGREKDIIIFSCVRGNEYNGIGFLSDPRRLNVALTRARYGLVIIGNANILSQNVLWNHLIHHCKYQGYLMEGNINTLRPCNFNLPSEKSLLGFFRKHSRFVSTALTKTLSIKL
uniref:AAA_12 domain-containing protein n=1 Tax=Rhabditophanes sp. KR3021 TaxID=114890 RepID=A0AC35UAT7_9BILA